MFHIPVGPEHVQYSFLAAIPYILQGASLLGGLFGHKKKKYLSPEYMRQKYGPQAISRDAQQYYNTILSSAYGRQLMASAATQGQEMQTDLNSRIAATGQGPTGGGDSASSDFAAASGPQIQRGLEGQVQGNVWQQALPLAVDQNQRLAELEMQNTQEQNADPTMLGRIGTAAGQAASMFPGRAPVAAPAAQVMTGTQGVTGGTYGPPGSRRMRRLPEAV